MSSYSHYGLQEKSKCLVATRGGAARVVHLILATTNHCSVCSVRMPKQQPRSPAGTGAIRLEFLQYIATQVHASPNLTNKGAQEGFESLSMGKNVHVRITDLRSIARGSH